MTPDWRHRRRVELGLKARNDNPSGIHGRHFLADFIICMCEFDFRQAQPT